MGSVFYESRQDLQSEHFFAGNICDHAFPPHVHDAVEILLLTHGELKMIVSEKKYILRPGDTAVAFPSIPHSYEYVSKDAKGLALIFTPTTINEFTGVFRTMIPEYPFLPKGEAPGELEPLAEKLLALSPREETLRRAMLHLFLAYLIPALRLKSVDRHVDFGLSYQVFHYISEHFTEPLTLESTSRALGISRIHLSHIFSQKLKINFRQYINTLRIDRACILLRDPAFSISQIVYLCGYGNPRTFHRAFMLQMNMTPNRFRKKIAEESNIVFQEEEADN